MIKLISYDGRWPSLCMGSMIIEIDGERIEIEKFGALSSGGNVNHNGNYQEWKITEDAWLPGYKLEELFKEKPEQLKELMEIINDTIPYGCCGGCI